MSMQTLESTRRYRLTSTPVRARFNEHGSVEIQRVQEQDASSTNEQGTYWVPLVYQYPDLAGAVRADCQLYQSSEEPASTALGPIRLIKLDPNQGVLTEGAYGPALKAQIVHVSDPSAVASEASISRGPAILSVFYDTDTPDTAEVHSTVGMVQYSLSSKQSSTENPSLSMWANSGQGRTVRFSFFPVVPGSHGVTAPSRGEGSLPSCLELTGEQLYSKVALTKTNLLHFYACPESVTDMMEKLDLSGATDRNSFNARIDQYSVIPTADNWVSAGATRIDPRLAR